MAESSSPLHPHCHPTEANQTAPSEPPSPASPTSLAPDSAEKTSRRGRGRPKGSKNKQNQPPLITQQPEPTINAVQFEIPPSCDIVDTLEKFARMHRVGVHILDGSGCIRNLTLQNNSFVPPGILKLVTLSGTFMDPTMMAASSSTATGALLAFHTSGPGPWLRIIANGINMEEYGGIALSRVEAASDVVVHGVTFKISEPKLMHPAEYLTIPERKEPSSGGGIGRSSGSGLVGGGGGGEMDLAPPGFGAPMLQQNWGFRPPMGNMRPSNNFN